ncbi:MAG TPA: hypothetical protein VFZ53_33170 [Polyangiaceae bacterium]
MKTRRMEDGSVLYFDSGGMVQAHDLRRGVLLHVRRGIMSGGFVPIVKADCERAVREAGRCVLMVDGLDVKMHTTEFREEMTAWFRDNENAFVHMLIRSPMVQMALNVANLVMGSSRATTYLNVSEWEAAGRKELASFARRPLVVPTDLST